MHLHAMCLREIDEHTYSCRGGVMMIWFCFYVNVTLFLVGGQYSIYYGFANGAVSRRLLAQPKLFDFEIGELFSWAGRDERYPERTVDLTKKKCIRAPIYIKINQYRILFLAASLNCKKVNIWSLTVTQFHPYNNVHQFLKYISIVTIKIETWHKHAPANNLYHTIWNMVVLNVNWNE